MTQHKNSPIILRHLGLQDYATCHAAMKQFTEQRDATTPDEIWFLEHPPIFTQGQNGKSEHLIDAGNIPLIQTDRGGQITYHGPGQLIAYTLIDLRRRQLNVREMVSLLENTIIQLLAKYDIPSRARRDAPGVYIHGEKIASMGLRIRRGCAYHGLALNVAMDTAPFLRIHPCGLKDIKITQLQAFIPHISIEMIAKELAELFNQAFLFQVMLQKS